MRYWISRPDLFGYRAFSRLGDVETPLPGPAWQIFLSNLKNGLLMFNWDDGEIWVHSVTHRPALDLRHLMGLAGGSESDDQVVVHDRKYTLLIKNV